MNSELLNELNQLGYPRVLVLGDLILDRYTWGDAERISQEAPVIVLRADHRESRLGGAANVGNMVRGLSAQATCVGVVGQDEAGVELRRLLRAAGIDEQLVLNDTTRPTTVKERFVGRACSRHPNQILRVDHESRQPLSADLESELVSRLVAELPRHDILLISDYGKGVCTPPLLRIAIDVASQAGIPVVVDPLRGNDFTRYRGSTVLKPNRVETESAVGEKIGVAADALRIGSELCRNLNFEMVIITLDRDGMAWVRRDGAGEVFAIRPQEVYDITGAGDAVLATLGVCLADGMDPAAAIHLSNIAAGLEVGRAGVSVVTRSEIRQALLASLKPTAAKVVNLAQATALVDGHRSRGQKLVFTNGCFDLLHVGHVSYLAEAAALGDVLIVGVNSDSSVRRIKGPQRPVIREGDRAEMLAALACVDYVLVFDDETPHRLLEALRPDVLVKGGTYLPQEVVGREVVERYGGRVCVTGAIDGISTTQIVRSIAGSTIPLRAAG